MTVELLKYSNFRVHEGWSQNCIVLYCIRIVLYLYCIVLSSVGFELMALVYGHAPEPFNIIVICVQFKRNLKVTFTFES